MIINAKSPKGGDVREMVDVMTLVAETDAERRLLARVDREYQTLAPLLDEAYSA